MTVHLSVLRSRALVLDIEGTTTPVDFVYQVLFPYARAHVAEYLEREGNSEACRAAVARLRDEHAGDVARGESPPPLLVLRPFGEARVVPSQVERRHAQDELQRKVRGEPVDARSEPRQMASAQDTHVEPRVGVDEAADLSDVVSYVHWLVSRDRKSPGLKALQGLIWKQGYEQGELRGQVYADVPLALARWRARGFRSYIYSSGSVLAQQLLFRTTTAGDLTLLLSGYFDTAVGPKTSPESYRLIIARIGIAPEQALFVSDTIGELDAAREADLRTALCVRTDGAGGAGGAGSHPVVHSFDDIID